MTVISRRALLAASVAGLAAIGAAPLWAQPTVNLEDLHAPGQLSEKVLGDESAPVTVIEYASMSCPHCASFHNTTFEAFRERYIDTGQVRFILREFPLNAPAYAVAMLARCAPADQFFDVVARFFETQDAWLLAPDLRQSILEVAGEFGFTDSTFDACITNEALFTGVESEKQRGASFGVQATPTFFINGKRISGALTIADLEEEIDPLL